MQVSKVSKKVVLVLLIIVRLRGFTQNENKNIMAYLLVLLFGWISMGFAGLELKKKGRQKI